MPKDATFIIINFNSLKIILFLLRPEEMALWWPMVGAA